MSDAVKNTDRELWRGPDEGNGSYYADSIHVTQDGGIGIDVGGTVIVRPLREWHRAATALDTLEAEVARLKAERDRIGRNRDMWKGQCERQAEQLAATPLSAQKEDV